MKCAILRLEGPLQAWGTQSKLGVRTTDREPSKSGVLGLVGSALGLERDDETGLAALCSLTLAVRVDRAGSLLRDYHTAGGGRFRGREHVVFGAGTVPSERYYLQDASFLAALSGDDALVERLAQGLRSPRWPLFLGRRGCPPSEEVLLSVLPSDAGQAVRLAPVSGRADGGPLRIVADASPVEGGEPRYDVPLSFREGARRYGLRYVRTEWYEPPVPATHRPAQAQEPQP